MQITVIVRKDVASEIARRQPASSAAKELMATIEQLGVTLESMHPGTNDPLLATYFSITVPNSTTAEQVIAQLQHNAAVDSVYLKPPDALP